MTRFEELNVGDVVTGEVSKVVPFGAFVRIADDADGLLHGEAEVHEGSSVRVRILALDQELRRASLARA
jgi:small subunit ribosomal protein S1